MSELTKNVQPLQDFNWDEFENGTVANISKEELDKAYDETLNKVADHQVVEGKVISVDKKEVVVNIGYKSDGIIPATEFRYNPDLKEGDVVEVYVETAEDKKGQLVLSHKKARLSQAWDRVNQALEAEEIVQGYIKCRTKGGMIVDVFGIEAFLPGSQIDVHPIRDYDQFVGKTMEFKIVKINQEPEAGDHLSSGEGSDSGGYCQEHHQLRCIRRPGWCRRTDPHHRPVLGPRRRSQEGSRARPEDQRGKINVVILDFDEEKKRIALGLKQLTPHPWDALDANLKVGDHITGKVVVIADYGAFVEVQPGVEGLIHVSEMSWSQHLRSAQEFLKVGDEVEAVILTLDREERKMSLGIKQLKEDPWEAIDVKYPIGSKHTAKVRNFTNFGVFVELEEGVDGLIHISDLSWTKKVKHPSEFTKVGEQIDVIVLDIDKENRRLSLGHKQLEENPWDVFEEKYTVGSVHTGKITEVLEKGAVVSLEENVEGFATPKHLVKEDGSQAQQGEELEFKVIEFNKDSKRIILSHSRTFEDAQRDEKRAARKAAAPKKKDDAPKIENVAASTTLGDLDVLAKLKADMEKGE